MLRLNKILVDILNVKQPKYLKVYFINIMHRYISPIVRVR